VTYGSNYSDLNDAQRASVDGMVAVTLKANNYNAVSRVLPASAADADSFRRSIERWADYFKDPSKNGGLAIATVGATAAHRILRLDSLGLGGGAAGHGPFLHQQLSL
jgi:hypothetical protein